MAMTASAWIVEPVEQIDLVGSEVGDDAAAVFAVVAPVAEFMEVV